MKRKIGVAALVALMIGALTTTAFAQCGTGPLLDWDADCLAYETNYTVATYHSAAGSQLTVVGTLVLMCAPFDDLIPSDPTKEYTFVFSGLTSPGTVHTPLGGGTTRHQTAYGSGVFAIYEGSPENAPTAALAPINPPNATVPSTFQDGTLILSGTLANFTTTVTQFGTGTFATSFAGQYQFTGPAAGTYYTRVQHWGAGNLTGFWCATGTAGGLCANPTGYSAHPNGKFDLPGATATEASTWGAIKQLYR